VETTLSEAQPYALQTVIYTVRVVSDHNIAKLDPIVPNVHGVAYERVGEIEAYLRSDGAAGTQVVNEFVFAVTPLREGPLTLPPMAFEAVPEAGDEPIEIVGESVHLESRAPLRQDGSWLPLRSLEIDVDTDLESQPRAGQPFRLTVALNAEGAGGSQLPSVAPMLRSDAFKFYPDQTVASRDTTADGADLLGRRVESYTVVPLGPGPARMPKLVVPWWSTDGGDPRRAVWAGTSYEVRASLTPALSQAGSLGAGLPSAGQFMAFLVLSMLLAMGVGVWVAHEAPGMALMRSTLTLKRVPQQGFGPASNAVVRQAPRRAGMLARLSRRLARTRWVGWLRGRLRAGIQIWRCIRSVEASHDANRLCKVLRRFASELTRLPMGTTLPAFVDWIILRRPRMNGQRLKGLVGELEASVYGCYELDLRGWKRSFKRDVRRMLLSRGRNPRRQGRQRALPALNPGA
jgi:hypothetical protein